MKKAALLVCLCLLLVGISLGQQPPQQLTASKVAGNVYALSGSGGNIGALVGPDGVLLIDTGVAPVLPQIKQALAAMTTAPIRYAVLTHYHSDHVASNAQLSKEAAIIAHENVRKRMATVKSLPSLNLTRPADPPEALPSITFVSTLTLHFNGEEIRLMHFPHAHTDGDTVVYFAKSNVVHMGDELFADMYPFVDVDNDGNVLGLAAAIDKIVASVPPDAKFIAGHGPVYTADQMKAYSQFLKDCATLVKAEMQKGKTLEQMKSEGVLAKYDKMSGFIKTPQFTEFVYRSLAAQQQSAAQ